MADGTVVRLARLLRFAGYDVVVVQDPVRAYNRALREGRILLTRNRRRFRGKPGVLLLDAEHVEIQLFRVFQTYPQEIRMGVRCVVCNGRLQRVPPEAVRGKVPLYVYRTAPHFHRCEACGRITWPGTHVTRVFTLLYRTWVRSARRSESGSPS